MKVIVYISDNAELEKMPAILDGFIRMLAK